MEEQDKVYEVPEFTTLEEYTNWHFERTAEGLQALAKRCATLEEAMNLMPKPGPNMIKYKPDGMDEYLNLKEIFDDIYTRIKDAEIGTFRLLERINKIEEKLGISDW